MIDRRIGGFSMNMTRLEMDDGALKYNAAKLFNGNNLISEPEVAKTGLKHPIFSTFPNFEALFSFPSENWRI
jgi:hypothetical protein